MADYQYSSMHGTNSANRIIQLARNKLGKTATVSYYPNAQNSIPMGSQSTHTDAKASANMFMDMYESSRLELLESGDWSFATERAELVYDENKKLYRLPENLVKIIKIGDCGRKFNGERFGDYLEICCICCNCILYIRNEQNVGLFSPGFTRALINKLAYEIGYTSGASEVTLNRIYRDYQMSLANARKNQLQQKAIRVVRDPCAQYGESNFAVHHPRTGCGDCCDC